MFGKMFMVGLSTTNPQVLEKLIKECHVGGLVLYSKNYKTYQDMLELISLIRSLAKEAGYPILIGIDEEGYRVNRLPKEIANLKSPYSFRNNLENIKEHGKIIANILAKATININFAPVLDIKRFADNHSIGDRCFGEDAKTVIKNTIPYINEFTKQGVIPVVKHFPGHGSTTINSHYFIPFIFNTKRLEKEDILPFNEAIKAGIDVIMVGHFLIPRYFIFTPTSFSKKTVKYLRDTLNYQGIIMSDDIIMGPLKLCSKVRIIKKAINNGINLIMVKYYDNFFKDFAKLKKAKLNYENILLSQNMLDNLIQKYHITNDASPKDTNITQINHAINSLNTHAK